MLSYLKDLSLLDKETLRKYYLETIHGNIHYNVSSSCVFLMCQEGLISFEDFQYIIR
mgnify:CR=1 FL=1